MHLQFELPSVRIDNSVWTWLTKEKLETFKLSTAAVVGSLSVTTEPFSGKTRLVVAKTSKDSPSCKFGTVLHNVNTAKEFREFDRKCVFDKAFQSHFTGQTGSDVYIVSFADLKTYVFTFNVAIPSVSPEGYDFEYCKISSEYRGPVGAEDGMYIMNSDDIMSSFDTASIADGATLYVKERSLPCDPGNVPFYIRSVLTRIATSLPGPISIDLVVDSGSSKTLFEGIKVIPTERTRVIPSWVKWPHPVTLQPTTIQSVDLKRFLDPATIASESVLLNVKLIKWRLIPSIEPEKMSSLRFLLVGAGTLGCAVARCLLSWGVTHITLVDSGKVSYSNPARQWLFRLEDAVNSAPKAVTAAERLKEILPSPTVEGIEMAVPLPGHPADLATTEENFNRLSCLVDSHDVVFMLTDSRESRWLPTLLVAAAQMSSVKPPLGVSVALGFDSYLVKTQSYKAAKASCYFCNDVNAPSDQTMFRTLDQQCTVTRPGLAAIASCMAVELVAGLSQSGFDARRSVEDNGTSVLGAVPDQVRGFLGSFQSFSAVTECFSNCICCSERVVEAFHSHGVEMVRRVINDSSELMRISGLEEFNTRIIGEEGDVIQWSDEEDQ